MSAPVHFIGPQMMGRLCPGGNADDPEEVDPVKVSCPDCLVALEENERQVLARRGVKEITAAMVAELRARTGARDTLAKQALVEGRGDMALAEEWLRVRKIR